MGTRVVTGVGGFSVKHYLTLALSGTRQAPRSGNLLLRVRDEQSVMHRLDELSLNSLQISLKNVEAVWDLIVAR